MTLYCPFDKEVITRQDTVKGYEHEKDPYGLPTCQWICSRKQGCRFSNSARTSGSDPESHAHALASRQALSLNTEALSRGGHKGIATAQANRDIRLAPQTMLQTCVEGMSMVKSVALEAWLHVDSNECMDIYWRCLVCSAEAVKLPADM